MAFENATRLRQIRLTTLTKPTGGGLTQLDLPKVGILKAIHLKISGTVTGTLGTVSPYGFSAVVQSCRLVVNSGVDLINISGPGYHWALRDFIDLFVNDPSPETTGRTAITATTFDASMVLPVALNPRDTTGLFMLQNEQTLCSLLINWEADSTLCSGGATYTATAQVSMEYYEVPTDKKDWPRFDVLHQVLEDRQAISGAGDVTYYIPRGNTLAGVYHLTQGTTWTRALLRAQQSSYIFDYNPETLEMAYNLIHGRGAALTGGAITGRNVRVLWDFLGTDGFGSYGSVRDLIDSTKLTDIASVISVAGSGTLLTVRRQLVPVTVG